MEQNTNILDYLDRQGTEAMDDIERALCQPQGMHDQNYPLTAKDIGKTYLGDRRTQLLEQGLAATKGDRNVTHGDFYEQHVTAAKYITIYLRERFGIEHDVLPSDVVAMLAFVKQSRMLHGTYNPDDHLDAAVYLAGRAECIEKEEVPYEPA